MRKSAIAFSLGMIMALSLAAQIPVNSEKNYEYHGKAEVKRASSGELQQRFIHWANDYFAKHHHSIEEDKAEKRFVTIQATMKMPESHFGVNRMHKDRELSYTLKFDAVKKEYSYWLNNIQYKGVEVDRKGVETSFSGRFEDFKSPTKASVESEIHNMLEGVIESFAKAADIELPKPEPEVKPEPEAVPVPEADSSEVPEPGPDSEMTAPEKE